MSHAMTRTSAGASLSRLSALRWAIRTLLSTTGNLLPHDYLSRLAPIPKQGDVRIEGVAGVLASYGEQHARRRDPVVPKAPLECRLHPDHGETAPLTGVDAMAVHTPGQAVECADFDVITQPILVVQEMLDDKPRVHDIPCVGGEVGWPLSRSGIGIEHGTADAKRLEVLADHDPFGKSQLSKARVRQTTQRRKPAGRPFRSADPAACWQYDLGEEG